MDGWRQSNIEETCDILDRLRKPITKRFRVEGPYPYYGATGVLDHVEGYLFDEPLVLVGEDGAKWEAGENSAFAIEGKCWVNNHAHVLRPRREIALDAWIIYFLNHSDLTPFITGLTVPKLNQGKLKEISIPLPPLPKQKQIVAILDKAIAAIDIATVNTKKNLANARELFESRLNDIFNIQYGKCAGATVSELATHSLGKMLDKKKNRGKLQPYLRNFNVRWFEFDLSDLRDMRFLASETERYTAKSGDLLICEGGYPGRAAIWQGSDAIHFQKAVHRVRFRDSCHTKWFLYFLHYMDATGKIRDHFTGTGIQHLTGKALASICMPTPPSKEIIEHVATFEAIQAKARKLTKSGENKLNLLASLKQSLLHQAFTGQLTADPKATDHALAEAGL